MPEALVAPTQSLGGRRVPLLDAASALGVAVVASASLLQGKLARGLPGFVQGAFGLDSDAHRALQFTRSSPGVTTALVGMGRAEHVEENLALARTPPARGEDLRLLFEAASRRR
jgi:predicted aldo/keto reductase-like oxidoreductase